jgi:UDP-glucose 4-epimerase
MADNATGTFTDETHTHTHTHTDDSVTDGVTYDVSDDAVTNDRATTRTDDGPTTVFVPSGLLRDARTVAVTGGLGFVGRHLVRALNRLGKHVILIDLVPDLPDDLPCVQHVVADLRDYQAVHDALADVDVVFHIAGNPSGTVSVERPRFDFEINALGTANVANAAAAQGVRRLMYLSSAIVYGNPVRTPITERHPTEPFLPYGASKLSGELVVRSLQATLGLSTVTGRAFVLYGPGEDPRRAGGEVSQFLRWHLNGRAIPVVGDIDRKTRDFLHVADLVGALLTLADRGEDGETYNIGSGTEVSMRELGDAVTTATGRPATLEPDPTVLEDSFRLVADISRLRALGFRPRVSLVEGIRDLAGMLGESPELPSCTAVFRRPMTDPAQTPRAQDESQRREPANVGA